MQRAVAAALTLAVAPCALADHDHQHIETVEVFGQAIPATITNLSSQSMAPGRETAESLRDLLGVSGSRMGGHGIDPSIRGMSQTQLNVLLDGAYVHGGCPNRMDPPTSYASSAAYQEVTVIRGSQTLAYGGGGPGGTVIFNRTTDRFKTDESVRGEVAGAWRSNSDVTELSADLALGSTQGFVRLLGSASDAGDYEDGNGDEVRGAYRERGGSIILGYTPDDSSRIELSYDHQTTLDALFPGAGMDSPEAVNDTIRLRMTTEAAGPLSNINAEMYRANVDHVMDNYSLRPNSRMRMRAPSTSDTYGGRLTAEYASQLGRWKFGTDAQYNERSARRFNDTGPQPALNSVLWPDVSIEQVGVFAELGHQLTQDIWLLGGLRYDHVKSQADAASLDPRGMPLSPTDLYSQYYGEDFALARTDHNLGGLLRIEYAPEASPFRFYTGLTRSVRTPDATERFVASNAAMPSGRWVGSPDIEPEQHHQLEVGGIGRWGAIELDVSLFGNNVRNYVLRDRFVETGNNASIYRNIDARLTGGEARIRWALSDSLSVSTGAAYVRGQNRSDDRAIAQIAPLEGFAELTWREGSWELGGQVQGAATQTRVDTTSATGIEGQGLDVRETPGWGVMNLFARYQLNSHFKIEAGIDNAFDKAYTQHLNRGNAFDPNQIQVNEPGRMTWIRVTSTM